MSRKRKGGTELFLKERKKVEGEEIMKRRQVYGGSKNRQVGIAGSLRSHDLCPVPGQEVMSPRKGAQDLRGYGTLAVSVHPQGRGAVTWAVSTCASIPESSPRAFPLVTQPEGDPCRGSSRTQQQKNGCPPPAPNTTKYPEP